MHTHSLDEHRHSHDFLGRDHARNERKSWLVIALCAAMMVAEIVGGLMFKSVALIADGLHMSTHAIAFLIAALAYSLARRHKQDERFAFGTGKFGDLAAFASAIILAAIAVWIGVEAIARLMNPVPIAFNEAIPIAALGLIVNLVSAALLHDDHAHEHHDHGHAHSHSHAHDDEHHHDRDPAHHHQDLNLRAAYMHVVADAAVSVLVIVGLLGGRFFGLLWLDGVMGLIGTAVIASWSLGLMRSAGAVLLDLCVDPKLEAQIKQRLEVNDDLVSDLHLWRVGPGHAAVIAAVVTAHPQPPAVYKARLGGLSGLSHVTVEVVPCDKH